MLTDKVVLVVGVGPGLGAEVARLALRDGARVMIAARSAGRLEATAHSLDPTGHRVGLVAGDIGSVDDCEAFASAAESRFGRLDALICVAAYDRVAGTVESSDFSKWQKAYEINVLGTLSVMRAALPAMRRVGGGSVVLIGSQSMYLPQLPQAGYAATKGALQSAMYYAAQELGPEKIRVNMVVPSWMWGPPVQAHVRMRAAAEKRSEDEVVAELAAGIPQRAIVADEDVAEAVLFFASERARCITGQTLMVNGGELMR